MRDLSGKRILLVDDDEKIVGLWERFFSRFPHSFCGVSGFVEALEIMEAREFHAVFLDLHLLDGTGVELGKEARALYPEALIVGISGFVSEDDLVRCREAGFDEVLSKPVKMRALLGMIDESPRCRENEPWP